MTSIFQILVANFIFQVPLYFKVMAKFIAFDILVMFFNLFKNKEKNEIDVVSVLKYTENQYM